jgi:ElaB/YqjD/DUF883 family membrane-anchored ribosome-binding protein
LDPVRVKASRFTPEKESLMEQVQEAKDQALEKVQEAGGQAKGRVREEVGRRSSVAGERVTSAASDARSVGEELRRQGKDRPAQLADQVADRAERVGDYLQQSDADRILRDVEDFGRRQPWAVAAGAFAIGLVASRFLKASSRDRYQAARRTTEGGPNAQALAGPALPNGNERGTAGNDL